MGCAVQSGRHPTFTFPKFWCYVCNFVFFIKSWQGGLAPKDLENTCFILRSKSQIQIISNQNETNCDLLPQEHCHRVHWPAKGRTTDEDHTQTAFAEEQKPSEEKFSGEDHKERRRVKVGGESKADTTPLLLFLNFDVMLAILYFSLNLDKGAWPRKILKPEFYSSSPKSQIQINIHHNVEQRSRS